MDALVQPVSPVRFTISLFVCCLPTMLLFFACVTGTSLLSIYALFHNAFFHLVCSVNPFFVLRYMRSGDFRMHLFALAELMLLYMVGMVMVEQGQTTLDETTDVLISTVLIALVSLFFLIFVAISCKNVFKQARNFKHRQKRAQAKEMVPLCLIFRFCCHVVSFIATTS